VQLAWTNGKTRYFGKFASLPEAERWIAEHLWLTAQVTQRSTQQQPDILDNKGWTNEDDQAFTNPSDFERISTELPNDDERGLLKMPLIPNTAVLQRIATLPLATYQAGETVLAAGTKTGRLLILRKGVVTIEKEGTMIAKVTEPGAVFGELSALLNQPHTADVRTLETSEFRVAPAELLEEDPAALMYVSAILAQRLNLANQAVVELKSQIELHHMIRSSIGKAVKKMEDLLSATGVYAPGIWFSK
jgi:CRP/FNR family cyclic AMP-dependent transcriptional regulator